MTGGVTPEALALLRSVLPPGALERGPSPSADLPSSADPIEAGVSAAAALWSEATGTAATELQPRDLNAIRVRVQEKSTREDFRAAFAFAASDPWYSESDRCWPRLVCGSRWEDCKRKGRRLLPSSGAAPSSSRRPVEAPPAAAPSPRPEPPETLPYGDRYSHPTRIRDHLGARYQPLPEEGIYLRMDLFMARGSGREAAE